MVRTTGSNFSDLTEMNRSAIVRILQRLEVCSRADIARLTGLTQPAITKIVSALMDMGIVTETGPMKGNGNRRSIGLRLNAGKHQVIGVKFARQMFSVGVFDISGKMYRQQETTYSTDREPKQVLEDIRGQIREALSQYSNVVAIGLALPGPYLREEGRIAVMTRLPAWRDINFQAEFQNQFDTPVFIEHDANAGALAEWLFGDHAMPLHTLAYLLVGEGVGSGVIERGNLLLGMQGAASETGHISVDVHGPPCECGNYGCLEMFCSAQAMMKKARESLPECFLGEDANQHQLLFQAAAGGDPRAREVIRQVGEYIGYGCVTLIYAYNPDIIVIGDIVSRAGALLLETVQEVVRRRTLPELHKRVQIKLSGLAVDPTLYGAAAVATNKVLQLPSAFSKVQL